MALEPNEIAQLLSPDDLEKIRIWAEQCALESTYTPNPLQLNSPKEQEGFRLWHMPVLEMQERHRVWIDIPDLEMGVLVKWGLYGIADITVYERGDDGLIATAPLDAYQKRLGMHVANLDALTPALLKAQEIVRVFEAAYVAAGGLKPPRIHP
jgi:hypothetical protein